MKNSWAFENPDAHRNHLNSHVAVTEQETLSTSGQYCTLIRSHQSHDQSNQ